MTHNTNVEQSTHSTCPVLPPRWLLHSLFLATVLFTLFNNTNAWESHTPCSMLMWQHHPEGEYCTIYNPKFTTANSRKTWRELGSAYNKLQLLLTWRLETCRVQDACDGYVTNWL